MEDDDGGSIQVAVNEFKCALGAAAGSRMPSTAGIRMGNEKYIFNKQEKESCPISYMTRQGGGGAVIGKFKTGIVIGIWHKEAMMSS